MKKAEIKTKNSNYYFRSALMVAIFGLFIWSCSQDQNPLPSKSHTEEWSNPQSENFHGAIVAKTGAESCKSCHGVNYLGGESGVSCYGCHSSFPHPKEWMVMTNPMFHGRFLEENNWNLQNCQKCHGEEYSGGSSGKSCFTCHSNFPHPTGWSTKSSTQFHGNDIRQNGWSLNGCKSCHGSDYKGGTTGTSCFKCHTSNAGPEGCNVCHGNSAHSYPPEDLNNNTSEKALGVGAHEKHMEEFECSLCHVVPASFSDPSHIDAPPAEVKPQWTWNRNKGTCATSCHGGSLIWNNFDD
jgi:hypothetical protein